MPALWPWTEKKTPGPSYPVGPNGQPTGAPSGVHKPSLSKSNIGATSLLSAIEAINWFEPLWTPTTVSSPSYDVWAASTSIVTPPPGVTSSRILQPVPGPMGGHCVNGDE